MAVDFNKIKQAVKERDDFLKEHRELLPLQEEINDLLVKAGNNPYKRCVLLQQKLLETWFRITTI